MPYRCGISHRAASPRSGKSSDAQREPRERSGDANANFGFIEIDWEERQTQLTLGIADATGKTRMSWELALASLAAGAPRT